MAASRPGDEGRLRELWERLEPYGALHSFRRHGFVYTPSQPALSLYLLRTGQVNLQMLSTGGRVLTLKVIEPGQIFGHTVLTSDKNYDTFAEAVKSSRALAVPRAALLTVMQEHPALSMALIESFGQHCLTVSRRLEEVAFKSVPARLASLLLDMANETAGGQPSRLPRRTHQQLAEMINAYRETVTKVINQFRAAHLLDIDRSGITLLNPSRLRELAQG